MLTSPFLWLSAQCAVNVRIIKAAGFSHHRLETPALCKSFYGGYALNSSKKFVLRFDRILIRYGITKGFKQGFAAG
jgi:hypothetical protein